MTDDTHFIAAREGFIYYSDPDFTQANGAVFK
jgi:hypothetical protein